VLVLVSVLRSRRIKAELNEVELRRNTDG